MDGLSDAYEALNINAVVLVGNREGVIYERAFGLADLDEGRPLSVSTRFKTESVGKLFTATRVLQLVEEGKLDLGDKAAKHLPGWKIPNLERITVHQLLTHTAGMASMWDHPEYDFSRSYTPSEMQRIIEEVPPVGEPGGSYFYSNSGFYLLGEIIAAVGGRRYDDDIRETVFDVAGMDDTGHLGATAMPPGTAQPYIHFSSNHWRPHAMGVSPQASPAGGWISTAHDLFAFARSYLDGRFIGPRTQQLMWTANGDERLSRQGDHYGYGVEVFVDTRVPGRAIVGHSGGGGGFSVDLFMEPDSGTVAVVMSNMRGMTRDVSTNYLSAALGLATRPARHSRSVRTVDHLLLKGLEYFEADPARFFAELDVPRYSKNFLGEVSNFLVEIGRDDLASGVERVSERLYASPRSPASGTSAGAP